MIKGVRQFYLTSSRLFSGMDRPGCAG